MAAPKVAVVGAGLVGLSTALCISEAFPGCPLSVLAEQFSPNTTGDVAAGMLIPHTYPGVCKSALGVQQRTAIREEKYHSLHPHLSYLLDAGLHTFPLRIFTVRLVVFARRHADPRAEAVVQGDLRIPFCHQQLGRGVRGWRPPGFWVRAAPGAPFGAGRGFPCCSPGA